ncbi:MAG: UvrD-helicase domain-containing protein [Candidatus Marinimicrobia bacterium]|nr:UvrD-helicase domain-containing protein [Candidatus Neomarinimicrobiota bacterium]
MNLLEGLNHAQREAVVYSEGPQLIFAGAGSGKTRVLTYKIAYLIQKDLFRAHQILAVTFTNKAAKELKNRVEDFVGPLGKFINVGTFHSVCARILREEITILGYTKNFTIYDTTDQLSIIKQIIKNENIEPEKVTPNAILNKISKLKSDNIMPEAFVARKFIPVEELTERIYPFYQQTLKRCNALDFDDLLILPVKIFKKNPEILAKYQDRFKYILVDEYQDTNKTQFLLISMLSGKYNNICVVGDDDQSIYSWRGADIQNILDFEQTFRNSKTFKLEQNYRSTKKIISAASAVVQNNTLRADKNIFSENEEGENIEFIDGMNEYDEATKIGFAIEREIRSKKLNFKDIAILYRTNAQSRVLETILNRQKIPNAIIGGVRFYERKEVKDIVAYYKFFANVKDDESFRRIINTPPRGIGKKTIDTLDDFSHQKDINLFEGLMSLDKMDLTARAKTSLENFLKFITDYQKLLESVSLEEWARMMIDGLGYFNYLKSGDTEEAIQRTANISELLNAISDYCSTTENPTLQGYLEEVALVSDIDAWQDQKNAISLMTLHSAKGLEFPVVFISGLNQGLLPLGNALDDDKQLNEERRLFYVGITRAEKKLYLTAARTRNFRGLDSLASPSQFLQEIPAELICNLPFQGSRRNISPEFEDAEETSSASIAIHREYVRKDIGHQAVHSFQKKEPVQQTTTSTGKVPEIGMRVTHKIFGTGTITAKVGFGHNPKLTIRFNSHGIKTIFGKFVNIID